MRYGENSIYSEVANEMWDWLFWELTPYLTSVGAGGVNTEDLWFKSTNYEWW